jgi:hypothetical protein
MAHWDINNELTPASLIGNYSAVGWSFGQFGRLSPELLWMICSTTPDDAMGVGLGHPDILQMLYVLRISSQCDSRPYREGSSLWRYLNMTHWHHLLDMEMMDGDTTEEFSDHSQDGGSPLVIVDDQDDSDATVNHYLDNTEGDP